jgi:mRNA deadenylase 3'-5' endonuclease subunit Ccr4
MFATFRKIKFLIFVVFNKKLFSVIAFIYNHIYFYHKRKKKNVWVHEILKKNIGCVLFLVYKYNIDTYVCVQV